jgi:ribosomal protein S27E
MAAEAVAGVRVRDAEPEIVSVVDVDCPDCWYSAGHPTVGGDAAGVDVECINCGSVFHCDPAGNVLRAAGMNGLRGLPRPRRVRLDHAAPTTRAEQQQTTSGYQLTPDGDTWLIEIGIPVADMETVDPHDFTDAIATLIYSACSGAVVAAHRVRQA